MKTSSTACITTWLMVGAILLLSGCACAQANGSQSRPPQPPREALEACKAAEVGDTCSFSSPSGAVSGTCWAPGDKPLACKPPGVPPAGPNGAKP